MLLHILSIWDSFRDSGHQKWSLREHPESECCIRGIQNVSLELKLAHYFHFLDIKIEGLLKCVFSYIIDL